MPNIMTDQSSSEAPTANKVAHAAGTATCWVRGTFNGATAALKASRTGADLFEGIHPDLVFTEPGQQNFTLSNCDVGIELVNTNPGTSITVDIEPV